MTAPSDPAPSDPVGPTAAGRRALAVWAVTAGCFAATVAGVLGYTHSTAHRTGHDPDHALQQLDLLYLDQPAPDATALGLVPGRPALVLFCDRCRAPRLDGVRVVVTADPDAAAAYALPPVPGGPSTGYALVDAAGRLRYRTYDPDPAGHAREIRRLVDGLDG